MDEPWVILGHEMCGHPKSNADNSSRPHRSESHTRHETTREGDRSAIDVENQIRSEHGQRYRLGSISAPNPYNSQPQDIYGSRYRLTAADVAGGDVRGRLSRLFGYEIKVTPAGPYDSLWRFSTRKKRPGC